MEQQHSENPNRPNVTIVPKEIYVQKWLNYHKERHSKSIDEANINGSKQLHEKARRHTFENCYVDPYYSASVQFHAQKWRNRTIANV